MNYFGLLRRSRKPKKRLMSKIGIYSGTFDPVHSGHIAFAEQAIDELTLDVLYMLPEPTPWRKTNVTPVEHRQKMIELVIKNDPVIKSKLDGMSDTHDVVSSLKAFSKSHSKDDIVLLMGADVFLNIDKWVGWEDLIERVEFAVALRTEDDGEELVYKLQEIPGAKVTQIVTNKATVTSSHIREQIHNGQDPKDVYSEVEDYIKANDLY